MKNKNNEDSKTVYFAFKLENIKNFDTIKQIRNFKELGYNSQSDLLRDAVMSFLDNDGKANNIKERKEEALVKIAEAKAERITEKEDKQLHKLNLENEILERTLNYHNTFDKPPTNQGQKAITKGVNQKYSNYNQPDIEIDIQRKKNFTILKENLGYVGKCLVCRHFDTGFCNTGYCAEMDIEVHLEAVHEKELYVR